MRFSKITLISIGSLSGSLSQSLINISLVYLSKSPQECKYYVGSNRLSAVIHAKRSVGYCGLQAVIRCGNPKGLLCGRSCNSISLIYGPLCALSVRSEKHQLRKWSFAASAFQISKFLKAGAQTRCEGNKYENLRHSSRKKVSFYARAGVLPPRLRLGLVYFFCVPDFFRLNI